MVFAEWNMAVNVVTFHTSNDFHLEVERVII